MPPKDLKHERPPCVAGCPPHRTEPEGVFRQAHGSLLLAGHMERPQVAHLQGVEGGEVSPSLAECPEGLPAERLGEAEPPACLSSVAGGFTLWFSPRCADDNSNQSSIADASPIKQENSSNSSPAPEPHSAVPGEGADPKADEAQADGKELPGAEGMCPQGLGLRAVG